MNKVLYVYYISDAFILAHHARIHPPLDKVKSTQTIGRHPSMAHKDHHHGMLNKLLHLGHHHENKKRRQSVVETKTKEAVSLSCCVFYGNPLTFPS